MTTVRGVKTELGGDPVRREEVRDALRTAFRNLKQDPWPDHLSIEREDGVRNKFVYQFHPEYCLVFRQQNRMQAGRLIGVDRFLIAVEAAA